MPGRASDLIAIPDSFWQRVDTTAALRSRDMGRFFALLHQYTGASQTQIGIACVFSQGTVSDIIRGVQKVEKLDVFERIADGLIMPNPARVNLGLAPRAPSRPTTSAHVSAWPIPSRDNRPTLGETDVSHLLSLESEDRQEEDPVRRRTFVGLTGASLLDAMLAEPRRRRINRGRRHVRTNPDEPLGRARPRSPGHQDTNRRRGQCPPPVPGMPVRRADQNPPRPAHPAPRRLHQL